MSENMETGMTLACFIKQRHKTVILNFKSLGDKQYFFTELV